MNYPELRMRRLRKNRIIEDMVAETVLTPSNLILPLFFDENIDKDRPVASMPGVVNHPLKGYDAIGQSIVNNGVRSVIVFGNPSLSRSYGNTRRYTRVHRPRPLRYRS